VLRIPFFNFASQISTLDASKKYLIFCEKGIMSKMQAITMKDHGFFHVSVLKHTPEY